MRSLDTTQSRRDVKCELKRAKTTFSPYHRSNPILIRKGEPLHCTGTEIGTPEIPESTISESSENPGSSSESRGSAQRATVHRWNHSNIYEQNWKCKRRCLLTTNMLKQDCRKVRRFFQRRNCINNISGVHVPNHDDHQQTRKKNTASDEHLREDHGSIEFLVNESLRLVKNLTLDASPTATSSAAASSSAPNH